VLGLLFGFLAALANATNSVLQRRAGREEDDTDQFSFRMIVDLVRKPVWLFGILAVIAGFLLQAIALSYGQLAEVEPLLILELPFTILFAWRFLDEGMSCGKGAAVAAMTIGLAGLIFFLSPAPGAPSTCRSGSGGWRSAADSHWSAGLGLWGRRAEQGIARAAVLGTATGAGFGMTAGLMKGMTNAAAHGFGHIFTAWQTYLMIIAGSLSMWLLQNAMAAGKLVAAQPGFTLTDPVVAILWGVFVFDEQVRHGLYLLLAVLSFALMVGAVIALSRTEEVQDDGQDGAEPDRGSDAGRHPDAAPLAPRHGATASRLRNTWGRALASGATRTTAD
jgi:hypothetical protein